MNSEVLKCSLQVDPQAIAFNRDEKFNYDLFLKLGQLGLLGVTVPEQYGGAAFDATAVYTCIYVHTHGCMDSWIYGYIHT
jgi:alkylation response protein AidB-like acyl-CoA dehydrogenase